MSEISESLRLRLILSFVTLTSTDIPSSTAKMVTHRMTGLVHLLCSPFSKMFSSLVAIALAASVSGQSCGCTADESCCQDNKGYACCIDQIDYCIAPNASVSGPLVVTGPARIIIQRGIRN